jgi:putative peptide zinc metalloprotease protein
MDRALTLSGAPQRGPIPLPALREDLRLENASANRDGSPSWMIHDPARNRFFRIGWLEFELLARWDAGNADQLVARVRAETPLEPDVEDVSALIRFLEYHQLLRARSARDTDRLTEQRRQLRPSLWRHVLHNYLFFRIPLVRPQEFLDATLPYVSFLLRPATLGLIALAGLIGLVLAARQWDAFTQSFGASLTLAGLFGYLGALAVAKSIHELAHAYVATRYGVRVAHMGIAFMVLWPMLYTDTGESWKLSNPRERLAIAGAGIGAEFALAGLATLGWSIVADGPLRDALFFLATTSWVISVGINASPFMRFDGYFLLSDLLDLQNLHERSSALARAFLRRQLLGWNEPDPEYFPRRLRALLVVFALVTWAVRLLIFIAIALAVYHFFFKLAGIILLAVELGWFVARPVLAELQVWHKRRAETTRRAKLGWLVLGALLLALLIVPWRDRIDGPAWARAASQHVLYAPLPGRLAAAPPAEGKVAAGAALFLVDSPDLRSREGRARIAAETLAGLLSRLPGLPDEQERRAIIAEQFARELAEATAQAAERARLTVRAPIAGVLLDVDPEITQGSWVRPTQALGIVVDPATWTAEVFIEERDLDRIRIGNRGRFFPRGDELAPISGVVEEIDAARVVSLPTPALAATHGGPIPTAAAEPERLTPNAALYRARLKLDRPPPRASATLGTAVIEGEARSMLGDALRYTAAVLIRESGF